MECMASSRVPLVFALYLSKPISANKSSSIKRNDIFSVCWVVFVVGKQHNQMCKRACVLCLLLCHSFNPTRGVCVCVCQCMWRSVWHWHAVACVCMHAGMHVMWLFFCGFVTAITTSNMLVVDVVLKGGILLLLLQCQDKEFFFFFGACGFCVVRIGFVRVFQFCVCVGWGASLTSVPSVCPRSKE